MKNEVIKPIAVLTIICLVVSLLLAVVAGFTEPVIEAAAAERLQDSLFEVLPEGDSFTELSAEGLPDTVSTVYEAANGAGYVFILKTAGYGGEMQLACGIGADGAITKTTTLKHNETAGMGAKTAEDAYRAQYEGESSTDGIDGITGATISSKAYVSAINDALAAFDAIK